MGERSFLEDAQNILKECVAAYSCEQMQAVAKALRQWRDKWAILLETVVRTCEDRDDMMAQRDALKAKVDTERQRQNATLAKLREELGADLGCGGGLVEILTGIIGLREQRDALKAKLADPRRVVIHGQTLLDAVKQIVAERKAAVLWAEKAEKAMTCKGCGGTVSDHLAPDQGGCPGSFEIDGVQMVPLAGRDNAVAQRDRAEADLATLRADRDAALIHLPVCCGSLADAADTLQQERDELAAERDDAKAKLAALVDFNVAELGRTRKEVWPDCEFCRDSTHDHECAGPELNPRWVELNAAIAAARGGAS